MIPSLVLHPSRLRCQLPRSCLRLTFQPFTPIERSYIRQCPIALVSHENYLSAATATISITFLLILWTLHAPLLLRAHVKLTLSKYRYGRLVRCDIPAPRTASSRLRFAFVEYESRRDADDAYHEMHNKRIGRDDLLKIEWARTPPSASWRFDSGRDRDSGPGGRRSPRRGRRTPSPRRAGGRGDYSPRKDDRRERDYDRRDRGDRSRSPDDRDRDLKDDRDDVRENGANGEDRKVSIDSPRPAHDELDTAE